MIRALYTPSAAKSIPFFPRAPLRKLAGELNRPRCTLLDEIRRDLVPRPNRCKDTDVWDYSAEIAQRSIDERKADKESSCENHDHPQ